MWEAGFTTFAAANSSILGTLLEDVKDALLVMISAEFAGHTGGDWLADLSRRPGWKGVLVIATTSSPGSIFAQALGRSGVPVLGRPIERDPLYAALENLGIPATTPDPAFERTAELILN